MVASSTFGAVIGLLELLLVHLHGNVMFNEVVLGNF